MSRNKRDAEIHLIDFIGNNSGCCVSDIAKSMQVTKGAVSQIVKKLEKKGYVVKTDDAGNKAKVIVRLTEKGRIAFNGHRQFHDHIDQRIFSIIDTYSEKDCQAICAFLQSVQEDWK
ncbi:MAG: MarR family transcriptional regulator [Lachnospiraceae bacterium]